MSLFAAVGEWVLIILVMLGALPLLVGAWQYLLIGFHRWHNHYGKTAPYYPRTAILVPAWNEAAVIAQTIERLVAMDYPRDRLRVYVVDDASTDATPEIVGAMVERYPGNVVHLRREKGGEGKAHTLNHGLRLILADDWMEALLIIDADVIFEASTLRKMTRHLADPDVGAVTAYIKEGSRPANYLQRFIAYEYITAQAAARRTYNVLGAQACLAGGAQLHSRANLEALGGAIDTGTMAEDTVTTIHTQLAGRKAIFEPNAVAWAEEPDDITGLWKQRIRWGRGNVQVTRRFGRLWFRPSRTHGLGGVSFGLFWFCTFLQPVFLIVASASLLTLYFLDFDTAWRAFRVLWITNAAAFAFLTTMALLVDSETGRRTWKEGLLFPGAVSVAFIAWACFPSAFAWLWDEAMHRIGVGDVDASRRALALSSYAWLSVCMLVAYLGKRLDGLPGSRIWSPLCIYIGGYGPLLCAVTFMAYIKEIRHADMRWDKTNKTGKVSVAA